MLTLGCSATHLITRDLPFIVPLLTLESPGLLTARHYQPAAAQRNSESGENSEIMVPDVKSQRTDAEDWNWHQDMKDP